MWYFWKCVAKVGVFLVAGWTWSLWMLLEPNSPFLTDGKCKDWVFSCLCFGSTFCAAFHFHVKGLTLCDGCECEWGQFVLPIAYRLFIYIQEEIFALIKDNITVN